MTPPHLPPRGRTRLGLRLTAGAAAGRFDLPVCMGCGTVQYPVREICRKCLSDDIVWQRCPSGGTVLAATALAHSAESFFRDHLPWPIGTVQLDIGPVVFVHLGAAVAPGTRVTVLNRLDRAGAPVLLAHDINAPNPAEEVILADPNRTIAGKTVLITGANGGIGQALVAAFVAAGAGRILAAARDPGSIQIPTGAPVEAIKLDVTQPIALGKLGDAVDILINNAGVNMNQGLLQRGAMENAQAEMAVNYFGTLAMIRAR